LLIKPITSHLYVKKKKKNSNHMLLVINLDRVISFVKHVFIYYTFSIILLRKTKLLEEISVRYYISKQLQIGTNRTTNEKGSLKEKRVREIES